MYEEDKTIKLEDWYFDLLQLQSDRKLFDSDNNIIEYPNYYNKEQLTIIRILKKIPYTPETLTKEEITILIKFFKNRQEATLTENNIPVKGKEQAQYIGGVLCENLRICKEEAKKAITNSI